MPRNKRRILLQEHVPNYVDGVTWRRSSTVLEAAGLQAVPWLRRWAGIPGFNRFSQSFDDRDSLLMAEFNTGEYYVVAHMSGSVEGLPEWSPK